jgi:hypothetical protein
MDSWVQMNPSWDVIILDNDNLEKYVELDVPDKILDNLSLNHKSDLVRLLLLSRYGGVWADATTFCMSPLNEWIDDYAISGFFCFHKPVRGSLMASWFIAAEKECPIVLELTERLRSFWLNNEFDVSTGFKRRIVRLLRAILNRSHKTTKYWFSPLVVKLLKVYPYRVIHFLFERVVSTDPECRSIWERTRKVSADGPHRIQRSGFFSPPNEDIKREIDEKRFPVYKLTWKYDHGKYSSSTLIYYLLEGRNTTTRPNARQIR